MKMKDDITKKNENTPRSREGIKIKIIVAMIIAICVILFLFVAVAVLDLILVNLQNDEPTYDFNFYEADYNENIFEDEEYLELIKYGYLSYNNGEGVTVSITEKSSHEYGDAVAFLVDLVNLMINGDTEGYNACFSELYYQKESPKERFTMQKIYDVTITKISEENLNNNGISYTQCVFALSYKIHENNGTLRDDFLTGSKTQYVYMNNESGNFKIDGITTLRYK